jgi:hypothetical protein
MRKIMKKIICSIILFLSLLTLQSCSNDNLVGAGNNQTENSQFVGIWNVNSLGSSIDSVTFKINIFNDTLYNSYVYTNSSDTLILNGNVYDNQILLTFQYAETYEISAQYNQTDSTMYGIGSTNIEVFHWLGYKK